LFNELRVDGLTDFLISDIPFADGLKWLP